VSYCRQAAIEADPKNPLAKYELANVLLSMERLEEALAELEALKARQTDRLRGHVTQSWTRSR
jgi:thioredoxin-like negative regulator of GroEL